MLSQQTSVGVYTVKFGMRFARAYPAIPYPNPAYTSENSGQKLKLSVSNENVPVFQTAPTTPTESDRVTEGGAPPLVAISTAHNHVTSCECITVCLYAAYLLFQ